MAAWLHFLAATINGRMSDRHKEMERARDWPAATGGIRQERRGRTHQGRSHAWVTSRRNSMLHCPGRPGAGDQSQSLGGVVSRRLSAMPGANRCRDRALAA